MDREQKEGNNLLRIATRGSALALWQAHHVRDQLRQHHPRLQVELVVLKTTGDRILDRSLAAVGGKGLFTKELEEALLDGRADLAVHSMKDVPVELSDRFALPVILEREDARDALLSCHWSTLAQLPRGARVGSSSLRRRGQLVRLRPDLQVTLLRGNVDTRLRRLEEGHFDAIILAAAGLKRLGLTARMVDCFAVSDMLPAVGQGAIGIETRAGDKATQHWLKPLHHESTGQRVTAERTLSQAMGGDCQVPVAGHAWFSVDHGMTLRGLIVDVHGHELIEAEATGRPDDPVALGQRVAAQLDQQGARQLLQRLRADLHANLSS
ncbi:MAG: hydroxymethylbilane synthase [Magnetococcales bacterium]|nr:hydroxymethylbilane synthase [Magnetococcales bacterium]